VLSLGADQLNNSGDRWASQRGWQVKLCDPLKTRAIPERSVMGLAHTEALYQMSSTFTFTCLIRHREGQWWPEGDVMFKTDSRKYVSSPICVCYSSQEQTQTTQYRKLRLSTFRLQIIALRFPKFRSRRWSSKLWKVTMNTKYKQNWTWNSKTLDLPPPMIIVLYRAFRRWPPIYKCIWDAKQ